MFIEKSLILQYFEMKVFAVNLKLPYTVCFDQQWNSKVLGRGLSHLLLPEPFNRRCQRTSACKVDALSLSHGLFSLLVFFYFSPQLAFLLILLWCIFCQNLKTSSAGLEKCFKHTYYNYEHPMRISVGSLLFGQQYLKGDKQHLYGIQVLVILGV